MDEEPNFPFVIHASVYVPWSITHKVKCYTRKRRIEYKKWFVSLFRIRIKHDIVKTNVNIEETGLYVKRHCLWFTSIFRQQHARHPYEILLNGNQFCAFQHCGK